jgi:hypothetical protein
MPEVKFSTAPQFVDWHTFIKLCSPPEVVQRISETKKHKQAFSEVAEVGSKRPRS